MIKKWVPLPSAAVGLKPSRRTIRKQRTTRTHRRRPQPLNPPQRLDFIDEQRRWRAADLAQRDLDNARALWARATERNRRDVEEKSEQLRALANVAALVAGFSLTGFLQFDWGEGFVDATGALLPLFGATMALTVGLNMVAVIACTLLLMSAVKTAQRFTSDEEEAEFMARARAFAAAYR